MARTFASPYLGREPKAKVATKSLLDFFLSISSSTSIALQARGKVYLTLLFPFCFLLYPLFRQEEKSTRFLSLYFVSSFHHSSCKKKSPLGSSFSLSSPISITFQMGGKFGLFSPFCLLLPLLLWWEEDLVWLLSFGSLAPRHVL